MDSEQPSFTDVEYGNRRRVSRREQFLETMDATIPWVTWVGLIEPHYYSDRPGKTGRKAKPVATMLRMYLLQVWFNLSDEGVAEVGKDHGLLLAPKIGYWQEEGPRPVSGPGTLTCTSKWGGFHV